MIAQTFQIQIIKINFLIIQDCIMKTKRFIHYCRLLKYKVVPGPTPGYNWNIVENGVKHQKPNLFA
jgi:hypothetical protein